MPQISIRRRLSISRLRPASSSKTSASATTLPNSISTDLTLTIPMVIGCRFMTRPAQSTQTLTRPPAASPALAGIMPCLAAPDGACHLPGTQNVATDP